MTTPPSFKEWDNWVEIMNDNEPPKEMYALPTTSPVVRIAWLYYVKDHAGQWCPIIAYGNDDEDAPQRSDKGYLKSANGQGPEMSKPIKLCDDDWEDGKVKPFKHLSEKYPRPLTEKEKEDAKES